MIVTGISRTQPSSDYWQAERSLVRHPARRHPRVYAQDRCPGSYGYHESHCQARSQSTGQACHSLAPNDHRTRRCERQDLQSPVAHAYAEDH